MGGASSCASLLRNLQTTSALDNETFLRDFPYDSYLDNCDVTDMSLLEKDRRLLEEKGRDGNEFLLSLFRRYLVRHPPNPTSMNEMKRFFNLADHVLAYGSGEGPRIYKSIGYMVLDTIDQEANDAFRRKDLSRNSREGQYLLKALGDKKYYIIFPTSFWEKLWTHIKNGDWPYIGTRLWETIVQYHSVGFVTFALFAGLMLIIRRFFTWRRKPPAIAERIKSHSVKATMIQLIVLTSVGVLNTANAQTLSEKTVGEYYGGDMVIKRLYSGSTEIGSTIWIKRGSEKIKARYFASGQISQRYSALRQSAVLVCSGSFTGQFLEAVKPQGLTVDDGTIVNRDLSSNMDALVIVYATGGIVVSDIQKDYLSVKIEGNQYKQLDILKSEDKTYLLDWAERNHATIFQTQLLASVNGLRLDVPKAHKELRERRFLAILQNKQTGEVLHVIVNVPTSYYLGQLAESVYQYLQANAKVVALLNLDVGDYDILQVNSPVGVPLDYPRGPKPLSMATNLLVYYYER